jgi:acyl-CoA reductase-like NAD-dependent aldehyde dehydrogenase
VNEPIHASMRIDGEAVDTDERRSVHSPFDDEVVGTVPVGTTAHIDDAVAAAAARHAAGPLPVHERARILDAVADALAASTERLARTISAESAKPITTARVEATRAVDTFRTAAAVARTTTGEVVPLDATVPGVGHLGFTVRVPVGVVAAITPFNFPLNLVAHKVAPAIAAGCPVVLKPASATPLTALALAAVVEDCGLPPGWLNVVTCDGATADHLVTHPAVALVTFTGSAEVGWAIRARAPRAEVSLELGNATPVVVADDVDDVEGVARLLAAGAFGFAGQSCISVQRVYATPGVVGPLTDALAAATAAQVVGDPADDTTQVSALITPAETRRVLGVIEDAAAHGADVVAGGNVRPLGAHGVLEPTLVSGMAPSSSLAVHEVFGPVVGVTGVADVAEGVTLANASPYGLQAGIFTRDLPTALDAARRLHFGGVTINEVPTWRADQMPYGGVGESGNTKEGPAWSVRAMTTERLVVLGGWG